MLLFVFVGVLLFRKETVQLTAALFQLPPRFTRLEAPWDIFPYRPDLSVDGNLFLNLFATKYWHCKEFDLHGLKDLFFQTSMKKPLPFAAHIGGRFLQGHPHGCIDLFLTYFLIEQGKVGEPGATLRSCT